MGSSVEAALHRRFWLIVSLLAAVLCLAQVTSALNETATFDEPVHLAAGYSYLSTGNFEMNPEHPPLAKTLFALPAYWFQRPANGVPLDWDRSQVVLTANLFLYRNSVEPERLLFAARAVNIGCTAIFAVYLAWWARRRFGSLAALFATALFVLDPNVIAHGRYVTTDVAAAFLIFTTATLWAEYLTERRCRWLVLTGISLGAAWSVKYSTLYLGPLLFALFWVQPRPFRRRIPEFAKCATVVTFLALAVVAIAYWPEVRQSRQLYELAPRITRLGPAGPVLSFLADRLNLPAYTFLIGIDRVSEHNAVGHPSYLLGDIRESGWWYYFPIAFAVKTPLAVLIAMALSIVVAVRRPALIGQHWLAVIVLGSAAAAYFAIAMGSRINIGVRHLLPVYAPLFVLIAALLGAVPRGRAICVTLTVVLALESAAIYPHYLTFFNVAAGGPRSGPKYLLDSNLDWGQAAKHLGVYMKRSNIPEVCLAFFGNVDLPRAGVNHAQLPDYADPGSLNCVAAVSATPLFGLYAGRDTHERLRERTPDAIVGNAIYVYDLRKNRP